MTLFNFELFVKYIFWKTEFHNNIIILYLFWYFTSLSFVAQDPDTKETLTSQTKA